MIFIWAAWEAGGAVAAVAALALLYAIALPVAFIYGK